MFAFITQFKILAQRLRYTEQIACQIWHIAYILQQHLLFLSELVEKHTTYIAHFHHFFLISISETDFTFFIWVPNIYKQTMITCHVSRGSRTSDPYIAVKEMGRIREAHH